MAREKQGVSENSELKKDDQVQPVQLPRRLDLVHIFCAKCGVEVDIVENDDPNDSLVEKILNRSVPDRDHDTYECRNGHNEGLVTEYA